MHLAHPQAVRTRERVQHFALLLLLAWLPSLAFFGHWEALASPFVGRQAVHAAHAPGSPREHEQHCHAGFDGCSGTASTTPAPVSASAVVSVAAPEASSSAVVLADEPQPAGHTAGPLTPPPRPAR